MTNMFIGTEEHPYHLSVGAVLVNDAGKFLAHRYDIKKVSLMEAQNYETEIPPIETFHTVMTETPESGEDLFETLHRGCMEEFGAEVEVLAFLGTQIGHFSRPSKPNVSIEKSMPFFLCRIKTLDDSRRPQGEIESQSDALFFDPEELADIFDSQFKILQRTDSNLGNMVRRAKNLL